MTKVVIVGEIYEQNVQVGGGPMPGGGGPVDPGYDRPFRPWSPTDPGYGRPGGPHISTGPVYGGGHPQASQVYPGGPTDPGYGRPGWSPTDPGYGHGSTLSAAIPAIGFPAAADTRAAARSSRRFRPPPRAMGSARRTRISPLPRMRSPSEVVIAVWDPTAQTWSVATAPAARAQVRGRKRQIPSCGRTGVEHGNKE